MKKLSLSVSFLTLLLLVVSCNYPPPQGAPSIMELTARPSEAAATPLPPTETSTFIPTLVPPTDTPTETPTPVLPTDTPTASPTNPPATPPPPSTTTKLSVDVPNLSKSSFEVRSNTDITISDTSADGKPNSCTITKSGFTKPITIPQGQASAVFQLPAGEYKLNCGIPNKDAKIVSK